MKVEVEQLNKPKFEPIKLTLNIVNQKEYDAIYFLFNYHPLNRVLESYANIPVAIIRSAMDSPNLYIPDEFQKLVSTLKEFQKEYKR